MASPYEYELQIDLRENYSMGYDVEAHQLDDITLKCVVTLEGSPLDLTNYTVRLNVKRPDGTDYIQNDPSYISKGVGYVNITCDNRLTVVSGMCKGAIHIYNTLNKQATTRYMNLRILADPLEVANRTVVESTITAIDYVNNTLSELDDVNTDITDKLNLANTAISNLTTSTNTANSLKSGLETDITNGTTLKNGLETDITNGTILKNGLETVNNEASVLKSNLTGINTTAQQTETDLHGEVLLANQKIIDLQSFDPNSVVQNTNILLSEIYCKNQLLSINHNLNGYPLVQLVYTQYGAGIGGAGSFPAGANSECNLMQNKVVYTDNNNVTVYVPDNYYFSSPSIVKVDNYTYIVTFASSTKSILVKLKL